MLSDEDRLRLWLCIPVYNDNDCWPWMGDRYPRGYGRFMLEGRRVRASRIVLELSLGRKLAKGEVACHTCDNPPCCNPRHLFAGSQADNVADCMAKGRQHIPPSNGENNSRAKLSLDEVAEIMCLKGALFQREIADKYGVSRQTVSAIHRGFRWSE